MRNIITLICLLVSVQAFAGERIDFKSFDNDKISFNCKSEKHERLHITLFGKGGASISEDLSENSLHSLYNAAPMGWKEIEPDIFEVTVTGPPRKDFESQYYANATLEMSPLGSFATGIYESGTYGSGFKEVKIECTVNQN